MPTRNVRLIFSEPIHYITNRGCEAAAVTKTTTSRRRLVPHPRSKMPAASFLEMIKNSQRKKQKRKEEQEQKLRAAQWLAERIDVIAVDPDGTLRRAEGDEAVEAIIRQWDRDEVVVRQREALEAIVRHPDTLEACIRQWDREEAG